MKNTNATQQNLIKKIHLNGPITIAEFMAIISYHHYYGYYQENYILDDFTTSPEISPIFGNLIALWFYNLWQKYYQNQEIILIELGGGNGSLMSAMLDIFSQLPIYNYLKIEVVEISELLQVKQKEILYKHLDKITWVNDLGLVKIDRSVFFIANEFFDCLPIHQFSYHNNQLCEILINHSLEKNFHFCLSEKLSNASYLIDRKQLANNEIIEISPASISIASYMNTILNKHKGLSLIIDYGYFEPTAKSSLQAIYRHQICSIFEQIGHADISAHVNFQNLQRQFSNCKNLFCTQKEFLELIKIEDIKKIITNQAALSKIDYLIKSNLESDMGNLFKILYVLYE